MTERTEGWIWRLGFVIVFLAFLALAAWAAWGATGMLEWRLPSYCTHVSITARDQTGKVHRVTPLFKSPEKVWPYCLQLTATPQGPMRECHISEAPPDMTYTIETFDRWKRRLPLVIVCTHAADGWSCQ